MRKEGDLIGTEIVMIKSNSKGAVKLTCYCPRPKRYRLMVSFVLRPPYTQEQGLRYQYNGRQVGPRAGLDCKTPVIFMILWSFLVMMNIGRPVSEVLY
jgi:hypothetical protein